MTRAGQRKRYVCVECGFTSLNYLGRCPECRNWESLKEESDAAAGTGPGTAGNGFSLNLTSAKPVAINDISIDGTARLSTGISELDRALGGGIVPGGLVLIGGEPGIGKSTLVLQMTGKLAAAGVRDGTRPCRVLYVSGEESQSQIKIRADRLAITSDNLLVFTENNIAAIESEIEQLIPSVVIIDSIQTMVVPEMNGIPGSLLQVRECAARLLKISKGKGIPVFLIGHVTKEGVIAGPRVLEHMVDTVLYFEGETKGMIRILRAVKNRFGSTDEIGIFEMTTAGLVEVKNPGQVFLSQNRSANPGVAAAVTLEGSRPLLVEIQGLACYSPFPQPRRLATGLDYNRMAICLAVLEKKGGIRLSGQDVYVNVSGGIRINDTGCDLAACMAVYSSFKETALPADTAFIGEVGLTGELRPVVGMESRIKEAFRNGFRRIILPASSQTYQAEKDITCAAAASVREAIGLLK